MPSVKPQPKREDVKPPVKPVEGAMPAPGAGAPEAPRPPSVQLLRGMKDLLPADQPLWELVRSTAADIARRYGYGRIDTPILEDTGLFTRAVGKATDIVEKEMFSFTDQGGDAVTLRPEATAAVARAYMEHGLWNQPQPVKLWYLGPMFRYDRPQAGRLRQFHQFGLEVLGEAHPAVDAELILMGVHLLRSFGIETNVQVNSIGCLTCRPNYEQELTTYLKSQRSELCEQCKRRMQRGAMLRILDCKEPGCAVVRDGAPQVVDWLCETCKQHFIRVLEYLDELEVPYALAPFLVRGLDYYTKTVCEFYPNTAGAADGVGPSALGGGGRYDALIDQLGGRPTAAAGIALGLERVILKAKEAIAAGRLAAPTVPVPVLYLAQLGDQAKRKAMKLFEALRLRGLSVTANFAKDSLKGQLEHANRIGVRFTLILGQKEVIDGTIIIREMGSGIQEIIAFDRILPEVEKRLAQEAVRQSTTAVAPSDAAESVVADAKEPDALKGLPPPPTIEEFEEVSMREEPKEDAPGGEG